MKVFQNEYVDMWIEEGILHFVYKPKLHITLEVAKKTVADRLILSNEIYRPILADVRNMRFVEKDAREYLSSREACSYITALAILTNTPVQNLFANVYLRRNQPPIPTKLFTDKAKALAWLRSFIC